MSVGNLTVSLRLTGDGSASGASSDWGRFGRYRNAFFKDSYSLGEENGGVDSVRFFSSAISKGSPRGASTTTSKDEFADSGRSMSGSCAPSFPKDA